MTNFELALAHVLRAEGGFVDLKNDRGGATNFGITRVTLETWRGLPVTAADVKALTIEEAGMIYRKLYWDHYGLDAIKEPRIALAVFDQIVNRRATEVVRGIQVRLGAAFGRQLAIDGVLGPKTLDALNSVRADKLMTEIVISAQSAYLEIVERRPDQVEFLPGWLARTWKLLRLV